MSRPRRQAPAPTVKAGRIWTGFAATLIGLGLGMAIVVEAIAERGPLRAGLRLRPDSARLLAKDAELALAAGERERAADLAARALRNTPFTVRALRVLGLTIDQKGDSGRADSVITTAGNWSLRDGPAHLWLYHRRAVTGDFGGALAHADIVMRRREDLRTPISRTLAAAAAVEPRTWRPIARRLDSRPNWRGAFLAALLEEPGGRAASAALALALEGREGAYRPPEQAALFQALVRGRQFQVLGRLRSGLVTREPLLDGGFERKDGGPPFAWSLRQAAGSSAQIVAADGGRVLETSWDGRSPAPVARQLLVLSPGAYVLSGRVWTNRPAAGAPLGWSLACADGPRFLVPEAAPQAGGWRRFSVSFQVPAQDCDAQWLHLYGAGAAGGSGVTRYDDLAIEAVR